MTRLGKVLKHRRRMSCVDHGLRYALKTIDHQHHLNLAPHLQSLEKETTPIELKPGQRLGISTGLFFIESGLLKCEADSSASLTRGAQLTGGLFAAPHMRADNSIGKVNARSATVGKGAQVLKSHPGLMSQTTFRIARVGPGWLIGSIAEMTGSPDLGIYTALTPCRLHQMTFESIERLEVDNPVLVLHLYKLLTHLTSRQNEMTINQLATLRSIMSSTAPTQPISRKRLAQLRKQL
mmetsp:Transcript_16685/g.37390  ORF Transcript_16685/g.37390 Transcript_16685/m.37390 type:complete len:237 (-) Transcript_16685:33-743(-)